MAPHMSQASVDVLVIVGADLPPPRLLARANHYLTVDGDQVTPRRREIVSP